jgi:hypothetical protein
MYNKLLDMTIKTLFTPIRILNIYFKGILSGENPENIHEITFGELSASGGSVPHSIILFSE